MRLNFFRLLREDWTEIFLERHVVSNENAMAHRHRKTHRLLIRIPDANRKAAS